MMKNKEVKEKLSLLYALTFIITVLFGVPALLMIILGYYSNGDEQTRQLVHVQLFITCISILGYWFAFFANKIKD
jgi:ABC-type Na+ efflux pump permease subunit